MVRACLSLLVVAGLSSPALAQSTIRFAVARPTPAVYLQPVQAPEIRMAAPTPAVYLQPAPEVRMAVPTLPVGQRVPNLEIEITPPAVPPSLQPPRPAMPGHPPQMTTPRPAMPSQNPKDCCDEILRKLDRIEKIASEPIDIELDEAALKKAVTDALAAQPATDVSGLATKELLAETEKRILEKIAMAHPAGAEATPPTPAEPVMTPDPPVVPPTISQPSPNLNQSGDHREILNRLDSLHTKVDLLTGKVAQMERKFSDFTIQVQRTSDSLERLVRAAEAGAKDTDELTSSVTATANAMRALEIRLQRLETPSALQVDKHAQAIATAVRESLSGNLKFRMTLDPKTGSIVGFEPRP